MKASFEVLTIQRGIRMGEIIIKVPGDIKEVIEIQSIADIKKAERMLDILFLMKKFPEVKHSIEVEEVTEDELKS